MREFDRLINYGVAKVKKRVFSKIIRASTLETEKSYVIPLFGILTSPPDPQTDSQYSPTMWGV